MEGGGELRYDADGSAGDTLRYAVKVNSHDFLTSAFLSSAGAEPNGARDVENRPIEKPSSPVLYLLAASTLRMAGFVA